MTLEQLRIFAAVAGRLHMTQAARELNITQSAASAAIAALEARHGVRLFNRVGRGLELSEAGRIFLGEAEAVLARADAAAQALDDIAGLKRGMLRIAASQTVANYWLPRHLAAFATLYPGVAISLVVGNTRQVAQAVIDGASPIGFVEGEVTNLLLHRTVVGGDRLSLYAAGNHPLATASCLRAADLRQAHWVMREPGSGTRAALEAALAARGIDPLLLHVLLVLPSNEAVLGAVEQGNLLTAVSDLAAAPHVATGRLHRLAFDLASRDFSLLLHKDRPPSRAVAAFLDLALAGRCEDKA